MRDHAANLRRQLSSGPEETEAKARSILKLFAVLASENLPADFAKLRQATYLEAVSESPAWAVDRAVSLWIGGAHLADGENRNFVPKPPELMRLVRLVVEPVRDECVGIERTVTAAEARIGHSVGQSDDIAPRGGFKALPPEEQAAVDAMRARLEQRYEETREANLKHLAATDKSLFERECQAFGIDPAKGVSPSLLKTLGRLTTDGEVA
jgi:hypothetical protein